MTFSLSPGQVTLLLGKSGSGKTSLLRCIAQIESEYAGHISYLGQSLAFLTPKKRCQIVGYVSQSYGLFPHMNVFHNCAKSLSQLINLNKLEIKAKVMNLLDQFGVASFIHSYPYQLSGGQRQRVALA